MSLVLSSSLEALYVLIRCSTCHTNFFFFFRNENIQNSAIFPLPQISLKSHNQHIHIHDILHLYLCSDTNYLFHLSSILVSDSTEGGWKEREIKLSIFFHQPNDSQNPPFFFFNSDLKICFIHPDLGIGGAEKLVVDAAVGLQRRGHDIVIYTAHHDPNHCFPETVSELKVKVFGDFLPRSLFHRFHLPFALLRFLYLSFVVVWDNARENWDVFFVDQIPATIPIMKLAPAKVIFLLVFFFFLVHCD